MTTFEKIKIPKNLVNNFTEISIKYNNNFFLIYPVFYNEINKFKNKIENNIENIKTWDKMKKITNPYELIYSSYNKYNNIAKYIPLSRSYFKMWEIINEFELFKNKQYDSLNIACLAEGPGGFMEAINNYRVPIVDKIYGITLEPNNEHIPGWENINLKYNFKITYGNLYNKTDIDKFYKTIDSKVYLITADGGFDYSIDFNNQESLSYRIIFCEITCALKMQQHNGHFICKIFDIFSLFMVKLILFLNTLYEEVYIYKPKTSRYTNSEKYLICKNFKGISNNILNNLFEIVDNWNEDKIIIDIPEIQINNEYYNFFYNYNKDYIENQIKYIELTIKYVLYHFTTDEYKNILDKQIKNAIEWCKKNKISINKKCKYFVK